MTQVPNHAAHAWQWPSWLALLAVPFQGTNMHDDDAYTRTKGAQWFTITHVAMLVASSTLRVCEKWCSMLTASQAHLLATKTPSAQEHRELPHEMHDTMAAARQSNAPFLCMHCKHSAATEMCRWSHRHCPYKLSSKHTFITASSSS